MVMMCHPVDCARECNQLTNTKLTRPTTKTSRSRKKVEIYKKIKTTNAMSLTHLGGGCSFCGRGGHDLVASGGGVRQHVLLDLAHHQDPVQRLEGRVENDI